MNLHDAITLALSPSLREDPDYAASDRALGLAIMAHPEWPAIKATAKQLFDKQPEAVLNMMVRFGYDIRKVEEVAPSIISDVSWCEALFNKPDPRPEVK